MLQPEHGCGSQQRDPWLGVDQERGHGVADWLRVPEQLRRCSHLDADLPALRLPVAQEHHQLVRDVVGPDLDERVEGGPHVPRIRAVQQLLDGAT